MKTPIRNPYVKALQKEGISVCGSLSCPDVIEGAFFVTRNEDGSLNLYACSGSPTDIRLSCCQAKAQHHRGRKDLTP